jgi:hypothetical protein
MKTWLITGCSTGLGRSLAPRTALIFRLDVDRPRICHGAGGRLLCGVQVRSGGDDRGASPGDGSFGN